MGPPKPGAIQTFPPGRQAHLSHPAGGHMHCIQVDVHNVQPVGLNIAQHQPTPRSLLRRRLLGRRRHASGCPIRAADATPTSSSTSSDAPRPPRLLYHTPSSPVVPQPEEARHASSLRTWAWRVRRSPCSSCPTTHPPYVPGPSARDHLGGTCPTRRDNPTSRALSHCHRLVCRVSSVH